MANQSRLAASATFPDRATTEYTYTRAHQEMSLSYMTTVRTTLFRFQFYFNFSFKIIYYK